MQLLSEAVICFVPQEHSAGVVGEGRKRHVDPGQTITVDARNLTTPRRVRIEPGTRIVLMLWGVITPPVPEPFRQ